MPVVPTHVDDDAAPSAFDYANVTGRPSAAFVTAAARVFPGVAKVAAQHEPYAAAWQNANRAALGRPGPRWIVLGDSMSQGIGATSFDRGWVNRVHDQLARDGFDYEIVNLSASGARVADLLDQQVPAWRALPAPPAAQPGRASRPDLVTVLVGSNDLLSREHRDQLPARFARLLDQLPDGSVVAALPQPRRAAQAVNELIAAAAAERRLGVVDMRTTGPSAWRGRLAEDHFHPNDRGYQLIADAFIGPVLEMVRATSPTK